MSVYDFNHNDATTNINQTSTRTINNHAIANLTNNHHHITSNGFNLPVVTHQREQKQSQNQQQQNQPDINRPAGEHQRTRNLNPKSSHEPDMSIQSTRPTSKTAMLVRKRRNMVEQLTCFICKGYLIDATTVDECMDSFCKSCLIKHLRTNNHCPKCSILVHETNPFASIRSDKVLQDIVYKLVPGLYDDEMKRRRDFYRGRYLSTSPNSRGDDDNDDDEKDSEDGSANSITYRFPHLTGEQLGVVPHPKPFYKPTDNIDLSIEPQASGENSTIFFDTKRQSIVTTFTGNLQENKQLPMFSSVSAEEFKTYLRCPAKFTAFHLKNFIAAKFNICQDDTIHLLYLNEPLKDQYSLLDIAYIYDWRGIEHMRLYYKIERNLTRQVLQKYQAESQRLTKNSSTGKQSVGTSTQTVKRVCIDPHPKYYDEPVQNDVGTNINGRIMRTRREPQKVSQNATTTTNGLTESSSPILRTSSATKTIQTTAAATSTTATTVITNGLQNSSCPVHIIRRAPINGVSSQQASSATGSHIKPTVNGHLESNLRKSLQPNNLEPIPKLYINLAPKKTSDQKGTHQASSVPDKICSWPAANNVSQLVSISNRPSDQQKQLSLEQKIAVAPTLANHLLSATSAATATTNLFVTAVTQHQTSFTVCESSMQTTITKTPINQAINNIKPAARPAQLAYTFRTDQGGIIVRRLHNTDGTPMTSESAAFIGANRLSQQTSSITSLPSGCLAPKTSSSVTAPVGSRSDNLQLKTNHQSTAVSASARSSSSLTQHQQHHHHQVHPQSSQNSIGSSSPHCSGPQTQHNKGHVIASAAAIAATESSVMNRQSSQGGPSSSSQIQTKPSTSIPANSTTATTMSTTPRHQMKGKPIYKTFVDPTKIKSPNLKKFGFSSRH